MHKMPIFGIASQMSMPSFDNSKVSIPRLLAARCPRILNIRTIPSTSRLDPAGLGVASAR